MSRFASPRMMAVHGLLFLFALLAAPSDLRAFEIQRVTSPGGIEAWLIEDHSVPVVAIEFAFEGGAALDPEGKEGLANLVTTLLDEGAGPLESEEFQRRLANNSISLDFDAGADAFFGSLKTLVETEDEAAELLNLALTEPRFDPDPVERMRAAVLTQIRRDESDPDFIARRTFYDTAFPDHPYGRRSKGTTESVSAIAIEDLRQFTETRLAKDNLTIGVTGDITPDRLATLLDRIFGDLPAESKGTDVPEGTVQGLGQTIVVEHPIGQSIVLMGQPGVKRSDPDWFPAAIMNYILGGGGFGSRLMEEIREKRGLTYGIYSYLLPFQHAALVMAGGSTGNPNAGLMIDLMKAEWRRMAEEGPTQAELDDAKTYLTGSFPLQFTSTESIAEVLLQVQRDDLGIDYLDRRNAMIEAVTLEDVKRVAARLLDPEALLTVVVGQPEAVEATQVIENTRG